MIIGHHLIWTAYGWWLPNDPRGSMSREIRVERVASLGPTHLGRKRVQPPGREIGKFYGQARTVLQHPLLTFGDDEVPIIAESFTGVVRQRGYTCYACAIMPDHVHLLIRKHRDQAEEMIARLQGASAARLIGEGRRPAVHPVWGGSGWTVFLNTRGDIARVAEYIRQNPTEARRPPQAWPFVSTYDGWLPGGHPDARHVAKSQAADRKPN